MAIKGDEWGGNRFALHGEALRKLTVRPWEAIRFPEPFAVADPLKIKSVAEKA